MQHECGRLRAVPNQLLDDEAGSLSRKLQGFCGRLAFGRQDVGAFSGPLALCIDFKFLPALDFGGAAAIGQRLSKNGCRRTDRGGCGQPSPSPEPSNSHTYVSLQKSRYFVFIRYFWLLALPQQGEIRLLVPFYSGIFVAKVRRTWAEKKSDESESSVLSLSTHRRQTHMPGDGVGIALSLWVVT
ncbi:hypothetical protein [Achromobacter pestifer]